MFEVAETVDLFLSLNEQEVELADTIFKAARAVSNAMVSMDKLHMLTPHTFEIQRRPLWDDQCIKAGKERAIKDQGPECFENPVPANGTQQLDKSGQIGRGVGTSMAWVTLGQILYEAELLKPRGNNGDLYLRMP